MPFPDSSTMPHQCDVVVVGGGPGGTTCANLLANAGLDIVLLERDRHPRFSIGESLLPRTTDVWRRLGLLERIEELGFIRKFGAYFAEADGQSVEYFHFGSAVRAKVEHAFEVKRDEFDALLWDAAKDSGARCFDLTRVDSFVMEGGRCTGVSVRGADGEAAMTIRARLTIDCSGRTTLLARQLDLRVPDPVLDNVALFTHYDDVILAADDDAGTIGITATDFGWMWLIPFSGGSASVGAVCSSAAFKGWKNEGLDREGIWQRILEEVRHVRVRLATSTQTRPVQTTANFSYGVKELAGDGWVVVGDAGAFLDPVFSSGVHLAMCAGERVSDDAVRALRGGRVPVRSDFAGYQRQTRRALRVFKTFIYAWYDPFFRQIFMHPPDRTLVRFLKRHIIALLAGDVFRPWLAMPPLYVLLGFARLSRWASRHRIAAPESIETAAP